MPADPSTADQRLPDGQRRRRGAFFTPAVWAEQARRTLDAVVPGWREGLVWDPACGTGNLTRGAELPDLLLSTLEPDEAAAAADDHPGTPCAPWDFLASAEGFDGLDPALRERLEAGGGRLLFLANPPYGTAGNLRLGDRKKTAIAANPVGDRMRDDLGLRGASQQLYAQFLVRMLDLAERLPFGTVQVGVFSKPAFLTARSFAAFRQHWLPRARFEGGFLFRADEFAQVSGAWGVAFTVWTLGAPTEGPIEVELRRLLGDATEAFGRKSLYAADGRRAYEWAKGSPTAMRGDGIQLKGGLSVHQQGRGRPRGEGLCWLVNDANDVYHSGRTVWLQSAGKASSNNLGGFWLRPDNLARGLTLFAARKAVEPSWINDKDEFLAPGPGVEGTDAWLRWQAACVALALTHPSNTCVGARAVPYKDEAVDLPNALFWFPAAYVAREAAAIDPVLAADARGATNPAVLPLLDSPGRPDEAFVVWALLSSLWSATLPRRAEWDARHPGLRSRHWDAGLHQLKGLFAEAEPDLWAQLRQARAELRAVVAAGVYEHGLLLR